MTGLEFIELLVTFWDNLTQEDKEYLAKKIASEDTKLEEVLAFIEKVSK